MSNSALLLYKTSITEKVDIDMRFQQEKYPLNLTAFRNAVSPLNQIYQPFGRTMTSTIVTKDLSVLETGQFFGDNIKSKNMELRVFDYQIEEEAKLVDDLDKIGPGEIYINGVTARQLDIKVNDIIVLGNLGFYSHIYIHNRFSDIKHNLDHESLRNIPVPFRVKRISTRFPGRIKGRSDWSVMLIDVRNLREHYIPYVLKHLQRLTTNTTIQDIYVDLIKNSDPLEYCEEIGINFKGRLDIYNHGNFKKILEKFNPIASQVVEKVGELYSSIHYHILDSLELGRDVNMYLNIISVFLIFGFVFLSSYLIYSLQLIIYQNKTYELAIFRMIGVSKTVLLLIGLTNSLLISIIGILSGIGCSILLLNQVEKIFKTKEIDIAVEPQLSSIIIGSMICVFVPLLTSINPLLKSTNQNIINCLDKIRSQTSSFLIIIIEKFESTKINMSKLFLASVNTSISLGIYFLLPLSMLSLDPALISVFMLSLLIIFIYGFFHLLLNFSRFFELFFLKLFFFQKKAIVNLIQRNLTVHKFQNQRIYISYGLSMILLIFLFLMAMMKSQIDLIKEKNEYGGHFTILGNSTMPISLRKWKRILKTTELGGKFQYSLVFDSLDTIRLSNYTLLNQGKTRNIFNSIFTISPNFDSFSFKDLRITEKGDIIQKTSLSLSQFLYTRQSGSGSTLISQTAREHMNLQCHPGTSKKKDKFLIRLKRARQTVFKELSCQNSLSNYPGFRFPVRPNLEDKADIITDMITFLHLLPESVPNFNSLTISKILLKNMSSKKFNQISANIVDEIKNMFGIHLKTHDLGVTELSLAKSREMLEIILNVVIVVLMFLIMFFLNTTVSMNLAHQTKELAILRSFGMPRSSIAKVYFYEVLVIILVGCTMGTVVDFVVSFLLSKNSEMMNGIKIKLIFPWSLLLGVLEVSLMSAGFAGFIPAFRALKKNIAILLKKD